MGIRRYRKMSEEKEKINAAQETKPEEKTPAPKKEKPPFRQPASNSGDDLWSFGSDGKSDDSDLSSDSDLSDLLL